MTLLISMLPLYLLGNLHCAGMCGPLVMLIGKHPYRFFYFFGRILSFTLAGLIAGGAGAAFNLLLKEYQIPAMTSFIFGGTFLYFGIYALIGKHFPGQELFSHFLAPFNKRLSLFLLQEKPLAIFLFGFFTISLPCGQTLLVFSACALAGDLYTGLLNGFAFALLTSPALLVAMHMGNFFISLKKHYQVIMGISASFVGILALCRGFADLEYIPHLVLNQKYHLVIF